MVVCTANFHDYEVISIVLETDDEIQLKVWKDLAISKQVLMETATKALGLTPECSTEDLRIALDRSIKRTKEAEINIATNREQTDKDIAKMRALVDKELAEMKALVASSKQDRAEAREQVAEATKARETAERQLAIGKSENAKALKEAKVDVADKQSKLKAISTALADTPENVIKKLKTLKKQKLDEAKIRTQIETKLRTTRQEKDKLEQEIEAQKAQLEQITPLVEKVREMHDLCNQANKKIKALSEDGTDLVDIPKLDEELLESLGKAT
jgi:colicin import membrane protein